MKGKQEFISQSGNRRALQADSGISSDRRKTQLHINMAVAVDNGIRNSGFSSQNRASSFLEI